MRERFLLFIILSCLGVFLYVFQNYVNTTVGFVILCVCMVIYGLYSIAATKYQKRKLKKHPPVVNENYKPFVSIMIPAHNEEYVIANTVENILGMDYPFFEVIIIDDRSTDNTAAIIKDLEARTSYPLGRRDCPYFLRYSCSRLGASHDDEYLELYRSR